MLKVKSGVTPYSLIIAAAVANAAEILKLAITITAGNNGQHKPTSKHYQNAALDIRTKDIPTAAVKNQFADLVMHRLGQGYQGLFEAVGEENEHLHIEHDPDAKVFGLLNRA